MSEFNFIEKDGISMKKITALVLALLVTISVFPVSFAAEVLSGTKAMLNEPTVEEMEKIIKIVKLKLDVPEECENFEWYYNSPSYYRRAGWSLSWYDKDYENSVSVTADSDGNIINYSKNIPIKDRKDVYLPAFSRSELAETAKSFLKKLCPEASESLVLTDSKSSSIYQRSYYYYFTRFENGIIVPDDTATVTVDYVTGEVKNLGVNFHYGLSFDGEDIIGEEKAKDIICENNTMNISYRLKNEYSDNGKLISRKAYLVYTPVLSYVSVDAQTGKIYTERNTWNIVTNDKFAVNGTLSGDFAESESAGAGADRDYELTEKELEQLKVLEGLITKDEAVKKVVENDRLYIEPNATAVEAHLNYKSDNEPYVLNESGETEEKEKKYVWNLSFSAPYDTATYENGYYHASMNAVVDAKTGEILSFSSSVPGYKYYEGSSIPQAVFDKESAEEIFLSFANEQIPDKIENTRKTSSTDRNVIRYIPADDGTEVPVYRCVQFNYVRVNEGVDFDYNTIRGTVDLATGKITEFSYSWYENIDFESPCDAITPNDAYRVLLDSKGFGLNYEINSNYTYNQYLAEQAKGIVDYDSLYESEQYTRLVYSGYDYATTSVSALGGKLITYNGEEYKDFKGFSYTDIEGHWAKKDIELLCDLDIGFEGDKFNPDSYITEEEYIYLLNSFGKYSNEMTPDKNEVYKNSLTRTHAVKYAVDCLGYYKIASMPDIFITDFADGSEIVREDVGFIAIARGLGVVEGNLGSFRPYDCITRAEAVRLVLNFVELG